MFVRICVVILACFYCQIGHSQVFDHLYRSSGLSQSTVLSIAQDSSGFLWFGTRDGLNRYDSHRFKVYQEHANNEYSISTGEYIYALLSDRSGNLWVGTRYGLNRYIPSIDGFEKIYHSSSEQSISDNSIYCIFQDSKGRLWFGTENGLNMLPSAKDRVFQHFYTQNSLLPSNQVYSIAEGKDGSIWVGTTGGLAQLVADGAKWKSFNYKHIDGVNSLNDNSIKALAVDAYGNVWIGTESGGVDRLDIHNHSFSYYTSGTSSSSLSSDNIRKLVFDSVGNLLIGTIDGLDVLDFKTGIIKIYKQDPENLSSIGNNSIKDVYIDRRGSIWVGTMYAGVSVMHRSVMPFEIYQYSKFRNSISSNIISSLMSDGDDIWIGTEGQGANRYHLKSGLFDHYSASTGSLSVNFIKSTVKDKNGDIWVGTYLGGVDRIVQGSNVIQHFRHNIYQKDHSLSSDNIVTLYIDKKDQIWVGTANGISLYDRAAQQFDIGGTRYSILSVLENKGIRAFLEDRNGNIWIGTTNGLYVVDKNKTKIEHFLVAKPGEPVKGYVNCIYEDEQGLIWVGTHSGGLLSLDRKINTIRFLTKKDGLSSNNILAIQEDNKQSLWLSTDNGISSYQIQTAKIKNYSSKDGLPTDEFSANASCKDRNGTLYFGSYNGLVVFNPDAIVDNEIIPSVVFTGLRLFDTTVRVGERNGLLSKDINSLDKIVFNYKQNVFTVTFAALNYIRSNRNKYAYKLEGFEKNWNYTSNPSATYMNLPSGNYTLHVKGSNNDGYWGNERILHIKVLPPWWLSWWAYLMYFILFAITMYWVITFFNRQARLERDLHHEHLNMMRKDELYKLRIDFFTKMSHEIRTPLTLILAPLEKLIGQTQRGDVINKQLLRVQNNAKKLLNLVGELLDFSKLEDSGLDIHMEEVNINNFLTQTIDAFKDLAISKDIALVLHSELENDYTDRFDPRQMDKVFSNLLSNALKFTQGGGLVSVTAQLKGSIIQFKVTDNGVGISKEEQAHIFDEFYQGQSSSAEIKGWGIGLAYSKKIVDAQGGSIAVVSNVSDRLHEGYTCFIIDLPASNGMNTSREIIAVSSDEDLSTKHPFTNLLPNEEVTLNSILIVEDNEDVLAFLRESLMNSYEIMYAHTGKQGWDIATAELPDLIISDVMMPEMDGMEFCKRIKLDDRTNHIPIILLTAKAASVHQMEGLQIGADAYITKPFNLQMLELTIRNMLALKEAQKKQFGQIITLMPNNKIISPPEEDFLERLMAFVEDEIDNAEFRIGNLVTKMGMSQTVLYKKIKSITGLSINDFIKSIRLKRGAQLLKSSKMSISEIAYAVGFTDPKYFGKEFRKQFGASPSEYQQK